MLDTSAIPELPILIIVPAIVGTPGIPVMACKAETPVIDPFSMVPATPVTDQSPFKYTTDKSGAARNPRTRTDRFVDQTLPQILV